jgi:hypothetical protein
MGVCGPVPIYVDGMSAKSSAQIPAKGCAKRQSDTVPRTDGIELPDDSPTILGGIEANVNNRNAIAEEDWHTAPPF